MDALDNDGYNQPIYYCAEFKMFLSTSRARKIEIEKYVEKTIIAKTNGNNGKSWRKTTSFSIHAAIPFILQFASLTFNAFHWLSLVAFQLDLDMRFIRMLLLFKIEYWKWCMPFLFVFAYLCTVSYIRICVGLNYLFSLFCR